VKLLKSLSIVLATLALTAASHAADLPPAKVKIADWPRTSVADFGCMLERTFGRRDARLNCSLTHYANSGDPCINTKGYYEGPDFPKEQLAKAIHPLARLVSVDYEHGQVRSVFISLDGKFDEDDVLKAFSIPPPGPLRPLNIIQVNLGDHCGPAATCVLVTGFDHMGAGDVDCSAIRETPKR
jgi:hypothetical protein